MRTWGSIIDALGGTGEVTTALFLSADSIVSGWRERGIPAGRWEAIVKLAAVRGCNWITFELLAGLAADKLKPKPDLAEARPC